MSLFMVNKVLSADGTGAMALEKGPYIVFKLAKNFLELCKML